MLNFPPSFHLNPEVSTAGPLAVYVHIPYCRQACAYCDFYFSTSDRSRAAFLPALLAEIKYQANRRPGPAATLYFGGGTPSRLTAVEWRAVFEALRTHFDVLPDAEITVEANPDDLTPDYLDTLRGLGVNRLSIGVQSFRDEDLQAMRRAHDATQAHQVMDMARAAGFDNFSIDLIYATPWLPDEAWRANLETALALKPPHISAYALTVEPGTLLADMVRKGTVREAPDETFVRQFTMLSETLTAAGYEHYELSNFALPGLRARHNSAYWQGRPYVGLGPSAHGYDGARRYRNAANVWTYIRRIEEGRLDNDEVEHLTPTQQVNEWLMTRVRTAEGLDAADFRRRFDVTLEALLGVELAALTAAGLLETSTEGWRLTFAGKLVGDYVTTQLWLAE